jgi:hypothetical protein
MDGKEYRRAERNSNVYSCFCFSLITVLLSFLMVNRPNLQAGHCDPSVEVAASIPRSDPLDFFCGLCFVPPRRPTATLEEDGRQDLSDPFRVADNPEAISFCFKLEFHAKMAQ